jgi:hypothetical protein
MSPYPGYGYFLFLRQVVEREQELLMKLHDVDWEAIVIKLLELALAIVKLLIK